MYDSSLLWNLLSASENLFMFGCSEDTNKYTGK